MDSLPPQMRALAPTAEWVRLSRKDPTTGMEEEWWVTIFDKQTGTYALISRKLYEQWMSEGYDGLDQIPDECLVADPGGAP